MVKVVNVVILDPISEAYLSTTKYFLYTRGWQISTDNGIRMTATAVKMEETFGPFLVSLPNVSFIAAVAHNRRNTWSIKWKVNRRWQHFSFLSQTPPITFRFRDLSVGGCAPYLLIPLILPSTKPNSIDRLIKGKTRGRLSWFLLEEWKESKIRRRSGGKNNRQGR